MKHCMTVWLTLDAEGRFRERLPIEGETGRQRVAADATADYFTTTPWTEARALVMNFTNVFAVVVVTWMASFGPGYGLL